MDSGMNFPDNFMDIFGLKKIEEKKMNDIKELQEQDENKRIKPTKNNRIKVTGLVKEIPKFVTKKTHGSRIMFTLESKDSFGSITRIPVNGYGDIKSINQAMALFNNTDAEDEVCIIGELSGPNRFKKTNGETVTVPLHINCNIKFGINFSAFGNEDDSEVEQ